MMNILASIAKYSRRAIEGQLVSYVVLFFPCILLISCSVCIVLSWPYQAFRKLGGDSEVQYTDSDEDHLSPAAMTITRYRAHNQGSTYKYQSTTSYSPAITPEGSLELELVIRQETAGGMHSMRVIGTMAWESSASLPTELYMLLSKAVLAGEGNRASQKGYPSTKVQVEETHSS